MKQTSAEQKSDVKILPAPFFKKQRPSEIKDGVVTEVVAVQPFLF